jgi:zinc resistance-associated protein
MKRAVFASMLIVVLALAAIAVVAQGRGMMGGHMGQGMGMGQGNQGMNCQQALGLTQAQTAEIQRLRTAFMNNTAGLRTQLQTKQQEMMQLWAATTPNLSQIKAKAREMDQIRAQIEDKAIDMHYAIVTTVLTPEQRAKCLNLCQSGQCGMGMGGGMGMGACPMMGGGMGMGPGAGMGMGQGAGMGAKGGCGMGSTGAGCPMTK